MTNPFQAKIKAALAQLNPNDPEHWTDDGLPITKVVQTFADEVGIKRSDINEVAPGFSKASLNLNGPAATTLPEPVEPIAPQADAVLQDSTETISEDDFKVALTAAFNQAEADLEAAKADVVAARKRELNATQARDAAMLKLQSEFPPMSAAENIQQFIRHEADQRAKAHGVRGFGGVSQLDAAMSNRGKARGWGRPQRGQQRVTMPDGRTVNVIAGSLAAQGA
jgi:hypothetical protein